MLRISSMNILAAWKSCLNMLGVTLQMRSKASVIQSLLGCSPKNTRSARCQNMNKPTPESTFLRQRSSCARCTSPHNQQGIMDLVKKLVKAPIRSLVISMHYVCVRT
ncbi:hypothetical protein ANCCAN_22914 [Ancylostoma caninum]|uniref:Uncharacterized protein n=1 Tax=Ancylostoma caninum TaxID=29170 RepID=A0A368FGQ1_ANCCA|nr:hypothetical protein ANCCAN_22914 [Ancylostoma caninum]